MAYSSSLNLKMWQTMVVKLHPIQKNETERASGSAIWKMHHCVQLSRDELREHYHNKKRNLEVVNTAITRKFGKL